MSGGGSRDSADCKASAQVELLPFGVLRRPHGTKGEILLAPYNDDADGAWMKVLPARVCWAKSERIVDLDLVGSRAVKEGFLVRFAQAESREAVGNLVGGEVRVARQQLPALSASEFYVEDAIGSEVYAPDGRRLGRVRGTYWNGAHEVMCVVTEEGQELFLPVLPGFVLSFDAGARRLTVDPHE